VNEHEMAKRAQEALDKAGVQDTITAAAVFLPRGHFAGAFAGGLVGGGIGDAVGSNLAGSVGTGFGAMAGMKAVDAAADVPARTMVAVSDSKVYGFDTEREYGRHPTDLVFALDRSDLEAKVHQRVNVRVLELIHGPSGDAIELEGPRLPGFHVGSVLDALHDNRD
jgi:hypothetical protein